MWLNSWVGTEEEIAVIRDLRRGESIENILRDSDMTLEEVTDLYARYLEFRRDDRRARTHLHRESALDMLDLLVETYLLAATRGDLKAAQLILAILSKREDIEARQRKEESDAGAEKNAGNLADRVANYRDRGVELPYDAAAALQLLQK